MSMLNYILWPLAGRPVPRRRKPSRIARMRLLQSLCAAICLLATTLAGAAWEPVGNAPAGIRQVAVGPTGDHLVARRDADVVVSADRGSSWTVITNVVLDSVYAATVEPGTFYATADDGTARSPLRAQQTLLRSRDGGRTWQRLPQAPVLLGGFQPGAAPGLLYGVQMVLTDTGFTGGESYYPGGGVWRSLDGGESWTRIAETRGWTRVVPAPGDARAVVVTGRDETRWQVLHSEDQGGTWTRSTPDLNPDSMAAVDAVDPRVVYLSGLARGGLAGQLSVTEDGGKTWRSRDYPTGMPLPTLFGPQLVADPAQGGRLYVLGGSGVVYESRDRGQTFALLQGSDQAGDFPSMQVVSDGVDRAVHRVAPLGLRKLVLGDPRPNVRSNLWWNPTTPGTGVAITQHASGQMFVVWYSFEPTTWLDPAWYFVSGGTWTSSTEFTGTMHAARGPSFFGQGAFDPSAVKVDPVGTLTIRFDGERSAVASYKFDGGRQGQLALQRFDFAPATAATMPAYDYSDLWYKADEPGWGLSMTQQGEYAFLAWYVYDSQGRSRWLTVPAARFARAAAGDMFTGDVYATRGPGTAPPAWPQGGLANLRAGTATLTFDGFGSATLAYTVDGVSSSRRLSRLPF